MSYDLGSYYQLNKRMSFALVAKDITSPDTGLASESQLPTTTTLGLCYREEGILVPFEVQNKGADTTYSAGFERWLFSNSLGLRAGLQEGSGSLSEVSCGMSYSYNNVIRFDYGFSMPLEGISGTDGSHRLSLVVSIGKPKAEKFDLTKQPKDYQDAVMAFERGEYLTAYDLFETIIKSLESGRELKDHSASYVKEIIARMQGKVKENLAASQVAYAKGLLAYSQPDYEVALIQLEIFAGIIPDNTEVNYYIELLKKMLGKPGAKPPEKPAEGSGGKGEGEEFPGLNDKNDDPLLSSMTKEEYASYKLRASLEDFKQGHYESSLKDCLAVIRTDPARELGYVRLGSAYYALGMQQYAAKAWHKALQLNPNNADLKEFMAEKNIPVK
jgi:tetratricopeptide (TPR) repeat protein